MNSSSTLVIKHENTNVHRENIEDTVAVNGVVDVNGVKDVNVATDRIYYELDGEGDADSSTTPGHNVDQRGRKSNK
ncbi:AMP deaminase 2 isoform X1 [Vespula squamosa]|uniref:AMP deaminase 2 isoform X1 n=1 Tax=Vespula squamosa TaxID=30214 RepID=A0ABD2BE84_VESSQ